MGKIANKRAGTKAALGVIPTFNEEILKATDVADILGVSLQVLRRYDIPRHLVGRNCLYLKSDVIAFVRLSEPRGVDIENMGW